MSRLPNEPDCCHICAQIAGDADRDLLQEILGATDYVRRIPLENDAFALIPSIGALAEGHVLVVPRHHVRSFAQLPQAMAPSAEQFLDITRRLISEVFGSPVVLFEHGTGAESIEPACSVDHAHTHVVPCAPSLFDGLRHRYAWFQASSEADLSALVGRSEYLRVSSPSGWMVASEESGFPSQVLRREVAQLLARGDAEWNWRVHPQRETVERTYQRLADALAT